MKNVAQEIHERSMWQVAGLYMAFCWLVLQVVQTLAEGLGLPDWVVPFALIMLAVGAPLVLVTAFLQKGMRNRQPEPPPQTLADVGEVDPGAPVPLPKSVQAWTWKRALFGGVGATALFALVLSAWVIMRGLGIGPAGTLVARGLLEERDVILLADFENSTDDQTLAGVVTEALRVDLTQSDAVRIADAGFIEAALARMERAPGVGLSEELAREIALREGVKALVVGDVARVGTGYTLTASVIAPEDQAILVSHRETAHDDGELLDAIDGLSQRIRERIGDPLASLASTPPLAQVTTSNLEALRTLTQAIRLPETEAQRRIALIQRAVELDSTFAWAWRTLGTALGNYGAEPGRVMAARARAFELRDRLTERERNAVASAYYLNVLREPRQAIPYLQAMVDADPTDMPPVNSIGEAYRNLGELATALDYYARAIAIDSVAAIPHMNVAQVATTLGDEELALRYAALLDERAPPFGEWHRVFISAAGRDFVTAEQQTRATREQLSGSPFLLAQTGQMLGGLASIQGRLVESVEYWEAAADLQAQNGSPVEALRDRVRVAMDAALARGAGGSEGIAAALALFPLADMDPVERPYLDIAEAFVMIGSAGEATRLLDEFEASTPENIRHGLRHQRHAILGELALLDGRFDEAIAEFRQSASRPQELAPMVRLARAFDAAGQADSARVHYRRFLDARHWLGLLPHARFLAGALVRMAELEHQAGELESAARYYAEFVELWAGADPELQPRVQAAQAKLQEIYDEIG